MLQERLIKLVLWDLVRHFKICKKVSATEQQCPTFHIAWTAWVSGVYYLPIQLTLTQPSIMEVVKIAMDIYLKRKIWAERSGDMSGSMLHLLSVFWSDILLSLLLLLVKQQPLLFLILDRLLPQSLLVWNLIILITEDPPIGSHFLIFPMHFNYPIFPTCSFASSRDSAVSSFFSSPPPGMEGIEGMNIFNIIILRLARSENVNNHR